MKEERSRVDKVGKGKGPKGKVAWGKRKVTKTDKVIISTEI